MTRHCFLIGFALLSLTAGPCLVAQETYVREWGLQFGTLNHDRGNDVALGPAGEVYLVGYTEADLGAENAGRRDAYLAKFTN